MPEGDTIFRAASVLRRWIGGRRITGGSIERLVGETVEEVEAKAKHLLIRCTGNLTLHTHMKMTGSWHVYSAGERWRRPRSEARAVLECGDRLAVCFNAPVVELIDRRSEVLHPSISRLGPDVLKPPIDVAEVRRRARATDPQRPIADVLLDQAIVSGIGNIWRAETLFVERVDPATPVREVSDETLDALVATAARLMTASVSTTRPQEPWVYGRRNRPCKRCRTPVRSARFENGRSVYWCPNCQRHPL
ncbi:MAG TPA: DNA-formamidopyrimidine glycosylase family protein [Acidimicrobiales bacterium]|nr:DNA-formamidopyrimidine glycosylase family protein [Acidimicrobiales bacterium]